MANTELDTVRLPAQPGGDPGAKHGYIEGDGDRKVEVYEVKVPSVTSASSKLPTAQQRADEELAARGMPTSADAITTGEPGTLEEAITGLPGSGTIGTVEVTRTKGGASTTVTDPSSTKPTKR